MIGIEESMRRLHETTDDRATGTRDTVGFSPRGLNILGKAVSAWIENKIERPVSKTRRIGHVSLSNLKLEAIAISDHPIL